MPEGSGEDAGLDDFDRIVASLKRDSPNRTDSPLLWRGRGKPVT